MGSAGVPRGSDSTDGASAAALLLGITMLPVVNGLGGNKLGSLYRSWTGAVKNLFTAPDRVLKINIIARQLPQ